MHRRVTIRCCCSLLFVSLGVGSLAGCSGSGGAQPDLDPGAPSQSATGDPAPAQPVPPTPAPAQPPSLPTVADVTCDGRKALALANAKLTAADPIALRRAMLAIQCDAHDIMARVAAVGTSASQVQELQDRTRDLAARAIDAAKTRPVDSSRLPLSAQHQQMYEIAAEAELASGTAALQIWPTNPWRSLQPLENAAGVANGTLTTALMRGERRALAVNIRSTSASPLVLHIALDLKGLPGTDVRFYRVNWTGNDQSDWAAAELEPLGDGSAARTTALLPGITQQIWIEVAAGRAREPGRFLGSVGVTADGGSTERIPLDVTLFRTQFPQRRALHFAGWDYADGGADARYRVDDDNRASLIAHLQSRLVDVAWGHRRLLHWKNIDAAGNSTGSLDSSALEQWLDEWRAARRFRVLLHAKDGIAGFQPGDPLFTKAVGAWAQAWAAEIRRLGRSPDEFDLSVLDEPHTDAVAQTIAAWAQAIRQSGAGFQLWTDPIWSDANSTPQTLVGAVDRIAINMGFAEAGGDAYWNWARGVRTKGKVLELYACEGPARRLDPYLYYRLASWRAFAVGASVVSFWNFSATGGAPSDNEFAATARNYSPLFINDAQVRAGKQMEAAAQGIQDAQYLHMLNEVAASHQNETVRLRANDLLQGVQLFIQSAPRSSVAYWRQSQDDGGADARLIEIGEFLDTAFP